MTPGTGFWELAAAGVAVGGTGVWGLAAAARVGALRLLLQTFPRPAWDAVTWGLIPALLLAPPVIQGAVLAGLAGRRPVPFARAVAGSVAGTLLAMAVFGAALLEGLRRLPPPVVARVAQTASDALVVGFGILLAGGWFLVAGRVLRLRWLGRIALPLAAAVVVVGWLRAHGQLLSLSDVLDRPEANGFFAAVAIGGAIGSAWAAGAGRRADAQPAGRR